MAVTATALVQLSATAQTKITVHNKSKETIWVTGTQETKKLTEAASGVEVDKRLASSIKMSASGSIGIPEVLEAGVSVSGEGSSSSKDYSNVTSSKKWDWSPFITAGEQQIPAGRSADFAIEAAKIYYLTVRNSKGFTAVNVPKSTASDTAIYVDDSGFLGAPDARGAAIQCGKNIHLKCTSGRYLGPNKKDYASMDSAAASYQFSGSGTVTSGESYALKCGSMWLYETAKGNAGLYGSDTGNASRWKVVKVTDKCKTKDTIIRAGDTVKLYNGNWTNTHLCDYNNGYAAAGDYDANKYKNEWVITIVE